MLEKADSWRVLVAAITLFVVVHVLDVMSTVLSMAYIPGSTEANPLFRDPETLKFLVEPAVNIKLIFTVFQPGLLSIFLLAGTQSRLIASLPWWAWAITGLSTLAHNFTMLAIFGDFR